MRYVKSTRKTVTPAIETSAYASGDALAISQTLDDILVRSGETGYIVGVDVTDQAKMNATIYLLFFSQALATDVTVNAAADIVDADLAKFVGHITISSGDYVSLNDNSVATWTGTPLPVHSGTTGGDLFMVPVSGGTPTYAGTADLRITVHIMPDTA